MTTADLPPGHLAIAALPVGVGPRRRPAVGAAHHRTGLLGRRHRAHPRRQLPRRDARQRRRGSSSPSPPRSSAAAYVRKVRAMRSNGLQASSYTPVADLNPSVAEALLDELKERQIAAYCQPIEPRPCLRLRPARVPGRGPGPDVCRRLRRRPGRSSCCRRRTPTSCRRTTTSPGRRSSPATTHRPPPQVAPWPVYEDVDPTRPTTPSRQRPGCPTSRSRSRTTRRTRRPGDAQPVRGRRRGGPLRSPASPAAAPPRPCRPAGLARADRRAGRAGGSRGLLALAARPG